MAAVFAGSAVSAFIGMVGIALGPLTDILAGAVAGYIARGSMCRGALAGFLSGMLGGLLLGIAIAVLLPFLHIYFSKYLGPLAPFLNLLPLIPILLSIKGAVFSAIGGIIGYLIYKYSRGTRT